MACDRLCFSGSAGKSRFSNENLPGAVPYMETSPSAGSGFALGIGTWSGVDGGDIEHSEPSLLRLWMELQGVTDAAREGTADSISPRAESKLRDTKR